MRDRPIVAEDVLVLIGFILVLLALYLIDWRLLMLALGLMLMVVGSVRLKTRQRRGSSQ